MRPLPRTYLFVPGNRPERFGKALASGADAVILDLEDAVVAADKPLARQHVAQCLGSVASEERARLLVRLNDAASPYFDADLDMLSAFPAATLLLPKAELPATILRLQAACPGGQVLALIETARGVLASEALAATAGVARLVFGTIDFALDLDLPGDPAGLDHAFSRLALASRAAGLPSPVAGVTVTIDDEAELLADFARARIHGFGAKLCIHPKQIAPVHQALQPTDAELAWARRVIAASEAAPGAIQVDGKMVDQPVIQRARNMLARGGEQKFSAAVDGSIA